jgi:hypothetical protein
MSKIALVVGLKINSNNSQVKAHAFTQKGVVDVQDIDMDGDIRANADELFLRRVSPEQVGCIIACEGDGDQIYNDARYIAVKYRIPFHTTRMSYGKLSPFREQKVFLALALNKPRVKSGLRLYPALA